MSSPLPIFDVSMLAALCQEPGFSKGPIATPDGTIRFIYRRSGLSGGLHFRRRAGYSA
jgi:hypothetical protein